MRSRSYLLSAFAATLLFPQAATSLPRKPSREVLAFANRLKAAGVETVACPKFVSSLKTGWSSSLPASAKLVCLKKNDLAKAFKGKRQAVTPQPATMILSGRYNAGTPFTPVVDGEGDVQTAPFVIGNVPAEITYRISNANYNTVVTMSLVNLESGATVERLQTIRGESADKSFAHNYPGTYYLKIQAEPDAREQLQPQFSVEVNFQPPEGVGPLSRADLSQSRIKTLPCPAVVVDIDGLKSYKLSSDVVCTARGVEEAGFTPAPVNLAQNIFIAATLERSSYSDEVTKPVRVSGPTTVVYSVQDPSELKGQTTFELVNLTTGRRKDLARVKGSISDTTTFINEPGDYFIRVKCNEYKPKELGPITWSILVNGGA
jgi:hypothetical protein